MEFINLTPHDLNLHNENGDLVATIKPSGNVARVSVTRALTGYLDDIPTYRTEYGDVFGLPEKLPDTVFIVSGMVRAHPNVRSREDVYQPGELLRDDSGRPVGAIGLSQ